MINQALSSAVKTDGLLHASKSSQHEATLSTLTTPLPESALAKLNLIGESPIFRHSMRMIDRVARTDAAVLIRGETGTGKELVARAIHYLGARREHPFVPVNCGALPDTLVENELFGHQRGAFTGAAADSPGLLRLAHGGTLFLDEVDSLPLKAQVSLLRVLQDRRYRPLGAHREEEADVRVVAACNRNLEELIRQGQFRADLFYRLKLVAIELPPLRARDSDAALLAEHFMRTCAQRYGMPAKKLHASTLAWLSHYDWPGNVRELENLIHSQYLLSEDAELRIQPPQEAKNIVLNLALDFERAFVETDELPGYAQAKAEVLAAFDRNYLQRLLSKTDGNVTRAAKIAGKERRALGKLIKRYKI